MKRMQIFVEILTNQNVQADIYGTDVCILNLINALLINIFINIICSQVIKLWNISKIKSIK